MRTLTQPCRVHFSAEAHSAGCNVHLWRVRPAARHQWQCRSTSSQPSATVQVPPLVACVQQRGGAVNGVTLANLAGRDGGSGWGLKSLQEHTPGSRLVELPRSCQLTYDETTSDPKLLSIIRQVPAELWGAKLALMLLQHRLQGPDSAFSPYIEALPRGFPGIPMFFPREAIEALEYPPVVEQVKKRCRWLHRFTHDVLAGLPGSAEDPFGGAAIDMNSLGWALAAVTSRAFRVRGPSAPAAMLPLIDMCNHSFEPNCEVLPSGDGVTMVAKRQIAAGEPLLLSYGALSNDFLLMDYGFMVASNPNDRVAMRFDVDLINGGAMVANVMDADGLPLEVKVPAWKHAMLKKLGLEGQKADLQVEFGGPSHVAPRMLAATRCLMATYHSEVDELAVETLGDWHKPLNRANEVNTLRALAGVCAVALSRFTTTLEQDQALLSSSTTSFAAGPASQSAASNGAGSDGAGPGPSSAAAEQLSEELRLTIGFRAERKKVLLGVMQALGRRVQEVQTMQGLKENAAASAAPRKGEKPRRASAKGFGAAG